MNDRWRNFRNSFFAGLLVVGPVALSLWILWWLLTALTDWLPDHLRNPFFRVVALLVMVAFTAGVGWVMRWMVGRWLVAFTEKVIGQVPVLNKTYAFMKEISQTLLSGRKTMFQRVVLVEFPRPGLYSIGFVTSEAGGEPQAKTAEIVVNVFIPTTPNPTSGFLVLVPRTQVRDLEMTVAEGMKMVISGGAVVPPYPAPAK
jgi:uncharacterized membrane protein